MKKMRRLFWGAVLSLATVWGIHGVAQALSGMNNAVEHITTTCTVQGVADGTCTSSTIPKETDGFDF